MKWRFPLQVALRYLWTERKDAAITFIHWTAILGVMIGVITLNTVMAVMTGFEYTLREKILGADAHIMVRKSGGSVVDYEEVTAKIAALPEVESVTPYISVQGLLRNEGNATGVIIRGVANSFSSKKELRKYLGADGDKVLSDFFSNDRPLPAILVGRELARQLGVYEGGALSLMSPQVGSTPFGLMPRTRRFLVGAVYTSGLVEYEASVVYLPLEVAQSFYRMEESVSGIEVRLHDLNKAPKIAGEILDTLKGDFYAQPWSETNRAFFEAIKLERRVYFIVLLLIVVMASFSIVGALVMVVVEKRRDIGVLRTLGATARDIALIFRIQGGVIGGVGVTLGTLGGLGLCLALKQYGFPIDERIFQMSKLPIYIDPLNFLSVAGSALVICAVATYYPARKASRLLPSEVLRYE